MGFEERLAKIERSIIKAKVNSDKNNHTHDVNFTELQKLIFECQERIKRLEESNNE